MSGRFGYCTTKSLHGIFRSFGANLWENIHAKVSSNSSGGLNMENAFNYETTDYWLGGSTENWLKICFKHHFAKPFGFELGSSDKDLTIKSFALSTSNDINTQVWDNRKEYNYSFEASAIHYFDYDGPPKRCFKLDCLNNTYSTTQRFDLRYIEMFGEIHHDISSFNFGTCRTSIVHLHFSVLFYSLFLL